jgi:hypothetical protein
LSFYNKGGFPLGDLVGAFSEILVDFLVVHMGYTQIFQKDPCFPEIASVITDARWIMDSMTGTRISNFWASSLKIWQPTGISSAI